MAADAQELDALWDEVAELHETGRREDALRLNAELIERLEASPREAHQVGAVAARTRQIDLLRDLSHPEQAIAMCDVTVSRFEGDSRASVRWRVALALARKAEMLFRQGRVEECIRTLDTIQARFGADPDAENRLQGELAGALDAKAVALAHLGREREASGVDDELAGRYGRAESEDVRLSVCKALARRAKRLQAQGDPAAALKDWEAVLERSTGASRERLRALHALALHAKLDLLWLTAATEELSSLSEEMIASADPSSLEGERQLAQGMAMRAALLAHADRHEEAVAAVDALTGRFPDPLDSEISAHVAQSLANKVFALSELGRIEEAEAVQQDLLDRFGEQALALAGEQVGHTDGIPGAHAQVQRLGALYSRSWFLHNLGRTDEALVVLDGLLAEPDIDAEFADRDENPDAVERLEGVVEAARALREQIREDAVGS